MKRLAALSLAAMGLWFALLVPLHPNILRGSVADKVLDTALWRPTHMAMAVVGLAGVFVAMTLVADEDRWLQLVTVVSAVATAVAGAVEATAFPLLANNAPETLSFDGGLFSSPLFVAVTGPWLLLPLCLAAIGWRQRAQLHSLGTAVAASGVAFFALGMWFVPIVGPISSVAFGASLLWWGVWLLRDAAGATGPSRPPVAHAAPGPR